MVLRGSILENGSMVGPFLPASYLLFSYLSWPDLFDHIFKLFALCMIVYHISLLSLVILVFHALNNE